MEQLLQSTHSPCGKMETPHLFFQWPGPANKTTTLEEISGTMTIWSISLKAYKSLSGSGFSTYRDAGKKVWLPW